MLQRILLVTDFGGSGPYTGQMAAVLQALAPAVPVIDLVADLPPFRPDLAAYLLPGLVRDLPTESLYLCVVDPGVGGVRDALALEVGGNWFVGPDNGLLSQVGRGCPDVCWRRVIWRPERLSDSFHGRDLFAPVAARIALGEEVGCKSLSADDVVGADWPEDLLTVVYRDRYGNLITGIRASTLVRGDRIEVAGRTLGHARTFCEIPQGSAFWYENAFGLVELAVNQGRADLLLGLTYGDPVRVLPG